MSLTSYRTAPPRDFQNSKIGSLRSEMPICAFRAGHHMPPFRKTLSDFRLPTPALGRPGSDLLSRVLRRSTIGAGEFNVPVRNGMACRLPAIATRPAEGRSRKSEIRLQKSESRNLKEFMETFRSSPALPPDVRILVSDFWFLSSVHRQ